MNFCWKTAIRFGILWGVLMTVFSLMFDLQERTFDEITSSKYFWIKSVGYILVGIFPIGYFSYSGKEKSNN